MQNIALQVTLNGIPQAVSNLKELELAIVQAREVLLTTTIPGSDGFKKLSAEIAAAESKLKNFKKQAEGKDLEGNLGDIGKLGGAIAGSFAAATAAVQLFGTESEEITKAVTTAQNALTLALGARSAAEGLVVVRSVAANIATKALTASTQASTAATRAFYRVLAANPYGAIIAAVGLLVGALVLLNKEESENEKQAKLAAAAQLKYADAVKTAGLGAKVTADQVGFLVNELENKRLTLEQVQPLLEKFVSGLKEVDLTTEEGQETLNRYITELANLAATQDQIAAKQVEYSEAIKSGNRARANAIRDEIRELTLLAARYQSTINQIEADDKRRTEEREKREQKIADDRKKRVDDIIAARQREIQSQIQLNGASTDFIDFESEVQKKLEERVGKINAAKQALDQQTSAINRYKSSLQDTEVLEDSFGKALTETRLVAEKYYDEFKNGAKFQEEWIVAIKKTAKEQATLNNLNDTQVQALTEYVARYEVIFGQFKKLNLEGVEPKIDLEGFERLIIDLELAAGKIEIDPFKRSPEQIAEARLNAERFRKEQEENFALSFLSYQKVKEGIFKDLDPKEDADKILELTKFTLEQGRVLFASLLDEGRKVVEFEQGTEIIATAIEKLNKVIVEQGKFLAESELLTLAEDLTKEIEFDLPRIRKNRESYVKLEEEIANKTFDKTSEFYDDIVVLQDAFAKEGIDISQFSYETRLMLLKTFLEKEVEATEEADKKKQDSNEKTIQNILDTIGQFQAALGAIQATTSDFFNFQFDQLEKRYNRIQESIVGDTEEANAKRLEAEKIYNAEKARLEKQAAKASLRIQLLQTIANAAQAVTVALTAGPVVGQILAGVVAAASLAQIGIVTAQLNAVDSYRKGGILKSYATGGYVRGPSHENGGVQFQGGGIELEGRESVINRVSTVRYQDLLNQINLAGGGSPIMANLDDSRIVEAIATQRREPIRAYVVQSEITSSQNIQKRLELLSQI